MKINDIYVSPTSDRIISASADETCKVIQRFFLFENNEYSSRLIVFIFIFLFWNLNSETSSNTLNIIFQAAPNRCILDNLEANLYVGLVNGLILCVPIKSVLHDSNKLITESENKSFIGHK